MPAFPSRAVVLPGTLDALEPLGDFVRLAAADAGFSQAAAGRLHLAVDEVATNTVTHAYEERGLTGELYLTAEADASSLRIHLEDTGMPYDPTKQADPAALDLPLEERGVGGLGIFLAKRNVDALLYERRGDRNRMTFVLNQPAPSTGAAV